MKTNSFFPNIFHNIFHNASKMQKMISVGFLFPGLCFFGWSSSIEAQSQSSGFRHPLQIQAVGLYNKVQFQANAAERRADENYLRNQNLGLEGEWKAFENVSFTGNIGYTNLQQTEAGSYKGRDRIGLGAKSAWESENWIMGAGILGFAPNPSQPKTENVNPDFYILRPYIGAGYKWGSFQIQAELHVQTETNTSFRERFNEEFRRHYQGGISASYGVMENLDLFLEMETRIPYDPEIDRASRYASLFPGVSIPTEEYGTFALSAGFPLIEDRIYDRSVRFQYFYFWD